MQTQPQVELRQASYVCLVPHSEQEATSRAEWEHCGLDFEPSLVPPKSGKDLELPLGQ